MERNVIEIHKLTLKVAIEISEKYMADDIALLELKEEYDNTKVSTSKYTEKEFLQQIIDGNVIIATLREDPIGYAIIKNGTVEECYVEWEFKDTELENILKNTKIQKNIITKSVIEIDS